MKSTHVATFESASLAGEVWNLQQLYLFSVSLFKETFFLYKDRSVSLSYT